MLGASTVPGNGAPGAGGFEGDTKKVEGVQVNGEAIRVLNPEVVKDLLDGDVKLSDLKQRLGSKIPEGYRLPTTAEIAKLRQEKNEKFGRLTTAVSLGTGFNILTEDEKGVAQRTSEWSAGFTEQNKGSASTEKQEPKLHPNDLIFLVKGESLQSANK
ncbi:hypothetical protein A3A05_00885 [Candidatus Nomurabacteria bacterium RIFCSPLOWO2_01_FULL_41_12]|uniref:Uncharacterized protein n=1 Tax=Candidatus Nomurabacteria bacterium RIFCSPLOWO2_01_FULL_41_12 TaxID=1801774 RepID=A0A1F6WVW6_9BACT|nr:MAG: hypothetical protein A2732_01300 [Candidatus Nomurabacteria bacterium RIFCSPHIGHO2_01_FULL_40_10]OGI86031.1 MAG: hypothetical protein A3A05_00885 [Candidatus Nomurabacteria bacterium RIFCSPLOWO2_01_FULL_41_12]